jgi:hypothetical protein
MDQRDGSPRTACHRKSTEEDFALSRLVNAPAAASSSVLWRSWGARRIAATVGEVTTGRTPGSLWQEWMLTNFNVVLMLRSLFVVEDTSHLFLVESSLTMMDRGHVAWHPRAPAIQALPETSTIDQDDHEYGLGSLKSRSATFKSCTRIAPVARLCRSPSAPPLTSGSIWTRSTACEETTSYQKFSQCIR